MVNVASKIHLKSTQHRGTIACARLVEADRGFGSLSMLVKHVDTSEDIALSWTDQDHVYYPERFVTLSVYEAVFVVAHELYHVALRHITRAKKMARLLGWFDAELWNIAADAIINEVLKKNISDRYAKAPKNCIYLSELLYEVTGERQASVGELIEKWSVEDLYKFLISNAKKGKPMENNSACNQAEGGLADKAREYAKQRGFENDMDSSAFNPFEGKIDEAREREWQRHVESAKAGSKSDGLLRSVLGDLPKTETPWQHVLRSHLRKSLTRLRDDTWLKPSRRYPSLKAHHRKLGYTYPYEQGVGYEKPVLKAVFCVDTSGSITDEVFQRFAAEINSAHVQTGCELSVVIGDAEVKAVHDVPVHKTKKFLRGIKFEGRGGTDFRPLIAEAMKKNPAIIVYLTDLYGPAGKDPGVPVVWAVPKQYYSEDRYPGFGKMIAID